MKQDSILERLTNLEQLFQQDEKPLTFREACKYLNISESHLYKLTYKSLITHVKPNGKNSIHKSTRRTISKEFLRKIGIPQNIVDYYSCFISYSSKDEKFAKRLFTDLQQKNIRCFYAPESLKIGDKIRPRIHESIKLYDKLLLVLSKDSIESNWVGDEVESALSKEKGNKPKMLFPIRIDNNIMESNIGWAETIKNTRHIGDFSNWKNYDDYQKAFDRLIRDLKLG